MKATNFYLSLLAISAFLAALIACGSGDVYNLGDGNTEAGSDFDSKTTMLESWILYCFNGEEFDPNDEDAINQHPECKELLEQSSASQSQPTPSSSSGDGYYPTSSDSQNTESSSSQDTNPGNSSSSTTSQTSSSSVGTSSSSAASSSSIASSSSKASSSSAATSSSSAASSSSVTVSSSSSEDSGSNDGCAYQASWCGGKYASASEVPGLPDDNNKANSMISGSGNCFFVTDISAVNSNNSRPTINGVQMNKNNNNGFKCNSGDCSTLLGDKKDGGYYVYNSESNGIDNNGLTAVRGTPSCL